VHSVYWRFSLELTSSTSATGHAGFTIAITFQPRSRPILSTAGSQCSACESPINTTLVRDAVSPNTQGAVEFSNSDPQQACAIPSSRAAA
jgi:hypothetical protein